MVRETWQPNQETSSPALNSAVDTTHVLSVQYLKLLTIQRRVATANNTCISSFTSSQKYRTTHITPHTHTHTHTPNGPLSGTTQVSRYQKGKTNLVLNPQLHTPCISSPNHRHLFAAHAHTNAACSATISRLCHLHLVCLSAPYLGVYLLP